MSNNMLSLLQSLPTLLSWTRSELSATRESLELLKKHHEALQRNSMKTTAGLQRKLQVAEEEVARSKVALSMEKHKVTKCYCMIV